MVDFIIKSMDKYLGVDISLNHVKIATFCLKCGQSNLFAVRRSMFSVLSYLFPALPVTQENDEELCPRDETHEGGDAATAAAAIAVDVGHDGEAAVRGVEERPRHAARLLQFSEQVPSLKHQLLYSFAAHFTNYSAVSD